MTSSTTWIKLNERKPENEDYDESEIRNFYAVKNFDSRRKTSNEYFVFLFFFLLCVYQRNSNIRISATVSKILFSLNNNNNKISPDDNKDIIRLSDLSLSSFRWAGFIPAKLMLPKTHAQCHTEIHLNCESFTFHISILWAL